MDRRNESEQPRIERSRKARVSWWWLWIVAAGLIVWWVIWGRGGYGDWWDSGHGYHTGTNGGRVSQPLGQAGEEPDAEPESPLGGTHNPNTGVPQPAKQGGTVHTMIDTKPGAAADDADTGDEASGPATPPNRESAPAAATPQQH